VSAHPERTGPARTGIPVWLVSFSSERHHYPPFGLLALANAWGRRGFDVSVRQLSTERAHALAAEARQVGVALVGLSVTAGPPLAAAVIAGRELREQGIPVVWGGAMPTTAAQTCLEFGAADVVVIGPGEQRPVQILESALAVRRHGLDPVVLRLDPATPAGAGPWYPDPSLLPNPARHLRPRPPFEKVAVLPLSRGCRRRCAFCAAPAVSCGRSRYDSADILRAADFWTRQHSADAVEYADDELLDPDFDVRPILERINRPFYAQLHPRTVSPEVCRWLAEAGCRAVKMGAESGSDRTLRRIHKGLRGADVERAATHLLRSGISPVLTFIIGFPDDEHGDLDATIDLAVRLAGLHPSVLIRFCHFTPFPGTELWHRSLELGFEPPRDAAGWAKLDIRHPVVPWLDHTTARILVDRLNEEYFLSRVHYLTRAAADRAAAR